MTISRRAFLFMTGSTGAAAVTEPARKVVNKLVPYVIPPEKIRPGTWAHYASTCRECPAGCGMHLWHRDGRITKAEGNPAHPVNRGALCARGQSALQGVYDPDRVRRVLHRAKDGRLYDASWERAYNEISRDLKNANGRLAIISELQTGALAEIMQAFAAALDSDRVLFYEAYNYQPLREAHQLLFGQAEIPLYRIDQCDFLISFACDFLETWISPVEFADRFSGMHGYRQGQMSRFAYVGPRLSMTAGNSDDFILVEPGKERFVALAMLQVMVARGWCRTEPAAVARLVSAMGGDKAIENCGLPEDRVAALARAFSQSGASLALAGPQGTSGIAARDTALAASLLNVAAGSIGRTVDFSRRHALGKTATAEEFKKLLDSLDGDDVLIIFGTNPVFTWPSSIEHFKRAGTVVHLTAVPDETSEIADWVLPVHSPYESWGDYSPYTGILGLLQPTMVPLYDTRNPGDVFIDLARNINVQLSGSGMTEPAPDFRSWLQASWRDLFGEVQEDRPFGNFWEDALKTGGIWQDIPSASPNLNPNVQVGPFSPVPESEGKSTVSLWLFPSVFLFDGRTANRGWLQEAPHPVTTVVWGSWVDLHPETAKRLGLKHGNVVLVKTFAGELEATVRISGDVAEGVAALPLGQGHVARSLSVAYGIGANPFRLLRPVDDISTLFPVASIEKTGKMQSLISLSATQRQFHRDIIQYVPLSEVQRMKPGEGEELIWPLPEGYNKGRDLYPPHQHRNHRWAMAVDLQRCIGCGACAVACYAENNIRVVGRESAARGLEMAWLKVVPYRAEDGNCIAWLPVLCQHCDAAPCEPVCPVYAAVHNEEGLNAQIYNRCIGTRYCSNNCPYKVRRFNWLNYTWKRPLDVQLNPEVTVRSRGVMEKCTFCVQRIRQVEYQARLEKREIRDGEIIPACQQTCPAGVFTFGDLLNPESRVSQIFHQDPRRYQLLKELNTKPAIVYLRKIRIEGPV